MNLKPEELLLFQGLKDSEVGKQLCSFLDRLVADLCDLRNVPDLNHDALRGRGEAAKVIENDIIKRIRMVDNSKSSKSNLEYV